MKRAFSVVLAISIASGALSAKGFDRDDVSSAHSEENGVSVGIGVAFYDGMFRTEDRTKIAPILGISINYGGFYIDGMEVGYNANLGEHVFATIYVQAFDGWKVKANKLKPGYQSIHNRNEQIALGGEVGVNLGDFELSAHAQGGKRGSSYGAEASYSVPISQQFSLTPAISYEVFSSKMSNYYFGIDEDELGGRIGSTYKPGSASVVGVHLTALYELGKGFGVSATAGVDRFSDEISRSPITDSRYEKALSMAISYKF